MTRIRGQSSSRHFLATSEIPEDADAPGLKEAREKLVIMQMSREEQHAKKALEIARKMKEQGLPEESIIEITGLTTEELSNLV